MNINKVKKITPIVQIFLKLVFLNFLLECPELCLHINIKKYNICLVLNRRNFCFTLNVVSDKEKYRFKN